MTKRLFNRTVAPLFLIGILALAGCTGGQRLTVSDTELPDGFPHHTVDEIIAALPAFPEALHRVYVESQVALSSPQESGRFSARTEYVHPDSMFVRVTFPLGIEGARVMTVGDSAWVYDRLENVVYAGTQERIASFLPGAIAGTRLIEMATGFLIPDSDTAWTLDTDSTLYLLHSPDGMIRFTIDPLRWRVVGIRWSDRAGAILEQRWYTDFITVENEVLPRRMSLSRPIDDVRISMAIRKIDLHPGPFSFDLDVRDDTRVTVLE
ncbi:MAG: DUF4292 domain-containing protein [Bacteroidetes bacterium]|nr:DUF4292 domain-containing protein [Bacteroidota bacterium]